jgi:hypothetical protein
MLRSSFIIVHHRSKYRRRRYSQWTRPSVVHHSKTLEDHTLVDHYLRAIPVVVTACIRRYVGVLRVFWYVHHRSSSNEGAGRSYPSGLLTPSYPCGSYRLVPKASIDSDSVLVLFGDRSSSFIDQRKTPEGHHTLVDHYLRAIPVVVTAWIRRYVGVLRLFWRAHIRLSSSIEVTPSASYPE